MTCADAGTRDFFTAGSYADYYSAQLGGRVHDYAPVFDADCRSKKRA